MININNNNNNTKRKELVQMNNNVQLVNIIKDAVTKEGVIVYAWVINELYNDSRATEVLSKVDRAIIKRVSKKSERQERNNRINIEEVKEIIERLREMVKDKGIIVYAWVLSELARDDRATEILSNSDKKAVLRLIKRIEKAKKYNG